MRLTRATKSRHPNRKGASSLSASRKTTRERYRQLEINYIFKPNPTEEQMKALAIVVELKYDQVRKFYNEKQSSLTSSLTSFASFEDSSDSFESLSDLGKNTASSITTCEHEAEGLASGTYKHDNNFLKQPEEQTSTSISQRITFQAKEPPKKPYECTWQPCKERFRRKFDWRRHEETHCPQWYWACTLSVDPGLDDQSNLQCTRQFKREDKLTEHLRKEHKCITSGSC